VFDEEDMDTVKVDGHQHFWKVSRGDYYWMGQEHAAIRRDFLPKDLAPIVLGVGKDRRLKQKLPAFILLHPLTRASDGGREFDYFLAY